MTKTIGLALAMALGASAAPAASKTESIVVSGESVAAAVSHDLDRQLASTTRFDRYPHGDGFAILRFERGADGRPQNVTFYRRSGVYSVDRLARTAVKRLGSRGGLPDTGVANQPFQANIVLATSERSRGRLALDLDRAERQRLASSPLEGAVIAISSGGSRKAS